MNIADTVRHARADLLDRTAQMIENACPLDEAGFTDAIRAVRAAGVQASDIAKPQGMAVSTVTRWEKGINQPHPILRKHLGLRMAVLARRAAEKLRSECEKIEVIAA